MSTQEELRDQAISRLKRKRAFWQVLVSYVVVNAFLVGVWFFTGRGYFWPGWVLLGWGIALAFTGWNAYGRHAGDATEADIRREMDKVRGAE